MSKYIRPENGFVRVPNDLIKNTTLSAFARVLFCILANLASLSAQAEYTINVRALANYCNCPTNAVSNALSELRRCGYLLSYRMFIGKKWEYAYVVYSLPLSSPQESVITTRVPMRSMYYCPSENYVEISFDTILYLMKEDTPPETKKSNRGIDAIIYMYIASIANRRNYRIYTNVVANELGYCRRTVQRRIHRLIDKQLIRKAQKRQGGEYLEMDYTIAYAPGVFDDNEYGTSNNADKCNPTECTPTGCTPTGCTPESMYINNDSSNTYSKKNDSSNTYSKKIEFNHNKLSKCPLAIIKACDWDSNRYDDASKQAIYNFAVFCVSSHYRKRHSSTARIIMDHLSKCDDFLCNMVSDIVEDCYWQIYRPDSDIDNPYAYIASAISNAIMYGECERRGEND